MAQNETRLIGSRDSPVIATKPGCLGAVARFWYRSYAADYISLAVLAAGWVMVKFTITAFPRICFNRFVVQIQLFVEPFHRMFSLDTTSIQFPFATVERVPVGTHHSAVDSKHDY